MTLVLIMLAALAQAGLARRSLQLATEANEAQQDLQQRWGTISCRRFLLDNAAERFELLEQEYRKQELPWPAPSQVAGRVTLGTLDFSLMLADEEAKLNLNTLQSRMPARFRQQVMQLASDMVPLSLRPDLSPRATQTRRWYTSWGQVFPLGHLLTQGNWALLREAVSQITCWGSGKINIKRASDELLEAVIVQEIDAKTAREFLEARNEAMTIELDSLLSSLGLRRAQISKLRAWLTAESRCFSLWIAIADGKRTGYHLFIQGDRNTTAAVPYLAFHW